jgi:hypothetical protein
MMPNARSLVRSNSSRSVSILLEPVPAKSAIALTECLFTVFRSYSAHRFRKDRL